MNLLVPLLVLIPFIASILTIVVGRRERMTKAIVLSAPLICLGLNTLLLNFVVGNGPVMYGQLIADAPGLFVSEIIFFLVFLAVFYSFAYVRWEENEAVYYAFFMLFLGAMVGTTLTYNLVVLLAFMEGSMIVSALLILFERRREALKAALLYSAIFVLATLPLICGIFLVYINAGTVNLLEDRVKQIIMQSPTLTALLILLFAVGFGTKAGLIPLGPVWLPAAHGEAPPPVSAVLSGVMIKLGVLAMLRTIYAFYPADFQLMSLIMAGLGSITMVVGIVYALLAEDVKKLLAWHSVSQMGYVMLGIGLATPVGIVGGFFHLLNHALFKSLLFLCSGAIIRSAGTKDMREMGGLFGKMPVTAIMFILGALAMSGVPPLNGFQSKFHLHEACVEAATFLPHPVLSQIFWVNSLIVSFLTFICLTKASYAMFFRRRKKEHANFKEAPFQMQLPLLCLGFLCVLLGVYPEAVLHLLHDVAHALSPLVGGK